MKRKPADDDTSDRSLKRNSPAFELLQSSCMSLVPMLQPRLSAPRVTIPTLEDTCQEKVLQWCIENQDESVKDDLLQFIDRFKSIVNSEGKTEDKTEVKTEIKSKGKTEVKTEIKSKGKTENKTEIKSKGKTENKTEIKSKGKTENKTEINSKSKIETKSGTKYAPEFEIKPIHIAIRGQLGSGTSTMVNNICGVFIASSDTMGSSGSNTDIVYHYADSYSITLRLYTREEVTRMIRDSLSFLDPVQIEFAVQSRRKKLEQDAHWKREYQKTISSLTDVKDEPIIETDPFWDSQRINDGFRIVHSLHLLRNSEKKRMFQIAQGNVEPVTRPNDIGNNRVIDKIVFAVAVPGGIDAAVDYVLSIDRFKKRLAPRTNPIRISCRDINETRKLVQRYSRDIRDPSDEDVKRLGIPKHSVVSYDMKVIGKDEDSYHDVTIDQEWPWVREVHCHGPFFKVKGPFCSLPDSIVLHEVASRGSIYNHSTKEQMIQETMLNADLILWILSGGNRWLEDMNAIDQRKLQRTRGFYSDKERYILTHTDEHDDVKKSLRIAAGICNATSIPCMYTRRYYDMYRKCAPMGKSLWEYASHYNHLSKKDYNVDQIYKFMMDWFTPNKVIDDSPSSLSLISPLSLDQQIKNIWKEEINLKPLLPLHYDLWIWIWSTYAKAHSNMRLVAILDIAIKIINHRINMD